MSMNQNKTKQIVMKEPGVLAISGDLSFETVPLIADEAKLLLRKTLALGATNKSLSLSLAEISRSDSAGLALLIDCLRSAKNLGLDLKFTDLPSSLKELMEISGLDAILPIGGAS
jgi:phospholipid transport system transporter-binding protein